MWVDTENNLTGRDLSHQDGHTHYPYNWQGNAYYNGQVGKLNIDLNVDFLTDKENGDDRCVFARNPDHAAELAYMVAPLGYQTGTELSCLEGTAAGRN